MAGSGEFAHLHTHTSHSVLDGLGRPEEMCQAAAELGQPALAITDHGTLGGAWKFARAAKTAGIKPVIGQEVYLSIGARFDRNSEMVDPHESSDADADDRGKSGESTKQKTKRYQHLTVLAKDTTGWQNLVRITNASWEAESFWYKPRADFDLLEQHSEGLIVLTGCLGGPVAGKLLAGDYDGARDNLARMNDIFNGGRRDVGAEQSHLFVEVMDHGIPAERVVIPGLRKLADEFGLPMVTTNDAHYTRESHADAHDCWLAVGVNRKLSDPGRFRFNGSGYYLRHVDQMREQFADDPWGEQAIQNTLLIASRCADTVLPEACLRLPKFDAPSGFADADAYLYSLVKDGAKERYGTLTTEIKERLRYESDVICGAGLADYFLIVHDMIGWARAHGVRVGPGRGSAAGSAVSYCLGIVNVDPIANNLLFERFLNPERAGMPDIDTDFDSAGRDRVIAYLAQRWGGDHVARIGTFGMTLSKKAIRDVARVTGRYEAGDKLARLVPTTGAGKPYTFTAMLDSGDKAAEGFRSALAADEDGRAVVEIARSLEGVIGTEGIHACGVVISDEPMNGLIPLRHERKNGQDTGTLVTQWDGKDVEEFGLLKLDALGLGTLDTITACVGFIEATTGERVDADNPPTDMSDPRAKAAWEMLGAGRTAGVFQLGSTGMTRLCKQIKPECLADLAAIVALYRPGPLGQKMHERYAARKSGAEEVDYSIFTHDKAEQEVIASVLDETYGVVMLQEQLMRLADVVAGFDAAQRNRLQKAFSKKKREEMEAVGALFAEGARRVITDEEGRTVKIAFSQRTVDALWKTFAASADYLFNGAHAYAYGYVSYITAYLKANWPSQYGAAVLCTTDKQSDRQASMDAMRAEGIDIRCPDVNNGGAATSVGADGVVRLGMSEVKGVGSNADWIVREREQRGPFASLADLLVRVKVPGEKGSDTPTKGLPLNTIEGLIEAGACDEFGKRMGLSAALRALRDAPNTPIPDAEWGVVERSARERERLGIAISGTPLSALQDQLKSWREPLRGTKPKPVHALEEGTAVSLGVLASWEEKSYKGGRMATMTLEGSGASLECVVWNDDLAKIKAGDLVPRTGDVVGVCGRVKLSDEHPPNTGRSDDFDDDTLADTHAVVTTRRREMTVREVWYGDLEGLAPSIDLPANVLPLHRHDPRANAMDTPDSRPEKVDLTPDRTDGTTSEPLFDDDFDDEAQGDLFASDLPAEDERESTADHAVADAASNGDDLVDAVPGEVVFIPVFDADAYLRFTSMIVRIDPEAENFPVRAALNHTQKQNDELSDQLDAWWKQASAGERCSIHVARPDGSPMVFVVEGRAVDHAIAEGDPARARARELAADPDLAA